MKKNYVIFTLTLFLFQSLLFSADDFPIATDNFSQTYPVVVFDGEDYLTVYFDRRGGNYSVYSKFVSTDGEVSSEQLTVPAHPALSLMPGLAIGDDNFLYTWSRQRGIWDYQRDGMAILIGLNGVPVSGMIQVSSPALQNSPGFMRTAYDGENYLVIWQDGMPTQDAQILGQFVSASDHNLVGSNFPIRPPSLGPNHAQVYPDILFDGTNYLVVWDDNRTGERSIYGWFLDTDGNPVGDDFVISNVPQRQMLVRAAFNGSEYLAIWADRRDGSKSGVYGQLFDSTGTLIGDNIPISPLADNHERTWPKVGSNGNQFLVAWEQQYITKGENVQDPIMEEIYRAAGLNPEKQSYVWWEVHGRIINSDGSFYTDEMPIGVNQYHQQSPEVAGQDNQFLTVWQDSRVNNQYSDIYGRFVTGVPADQLPVPENLTAEFTGEEIHLNWEPPAGKTLLHYNVYRDGNLIEQEVQDTEYLDEDFEQSTTYSYHVTAVYDSGESGPSNTATVDVPILYVTVTFQVNDQDNMAIEGAQVIFGDHDPQLTDSDGIAIFEQVDANSTVSYEVSKDYYNTESGTIEVQEEDITETVTLILVPPYVSVGFVVTDVEDNPIQGAEVWFEGGNGTETTDASGTVVFWEVEPNDWYYYEVYKEGYFADIDMVEVLDEDLIVEIVLIVDDTSVFDAQQDALFNISPNPANDLLRISGPETVRHIEIIDVSGSRVKRFSGINQRNALLDISDLKSGMYVLVIQDQQGRMHRVSFIKE